MSRNRMWLKTHDTDYFVSPCDEDGKVQFVQTVSTIPPIAPTPCPQDIPVKWVEWVRRDGR